MGRLLNIGIFLCAQLVFCGCSSSESTINHADAGTELSTPKQMPTLVGGLESIEKQLVYPATAREAGVKGRILVQFVVTKEGKVEDAHIARDTGLGYGLDEEAIRVIKLARFKPALDKDGKPMRLKMALPVTFK